MKQWSHSPNPNSLDPEPTLVNDYAITSVSEDMKIGNNICTKLQKCIKHFKGKS